MTQYDPNLKLTMRLTKAAQAYVQGLREGLTPQAITQAFLRSFQRIGSLCAAYIVKTWLSGNPLNRRTGQLARAMVGDGVMRDGRPGFRAGVLQGPATRYAGVHEYGAVIYPVRARTLAIPVNESLTPAGVARYQGPRDDPRELTYIPVRGNNKLVGLLKPTAEMRAAKAAGQPERDVPAAYLLLKYVVIPARPFLRWGMRGFLQLPETKRLLLQTLKEVLSGRGQGHRST